MVCPHTLPAGWRFVRCTIAAIFMILYLPSVGLHTPGTGAGIHFSNTAEARDENLAGSNSTGPHGRLREWSIGQNDAPVTIVEYASLTCQACARFIHTVFPELKRKYIDTGAVRFIVRPFPLDPLAAAASMLPVCAGPTRGFDVFEILLQHSEKWSRAENPKSGLLSLAKQMGFTEQSFEDCLKNQKVLDDINFTKKHVSENFGVDATPLFFINGERLPNVPSFDVLEVRIRGLLNEPDM